MSPVNYRLELPTQWSIHPVFHIDLLTPYRETITHGTNYLRPPPDLVDNEEEYEVEKILDSRLFGRHKRLQYLVKWAGYPDSENMWVDKDDVFAEDKVREFKASSSDSGTHIRHLWKNGIPQFTLAPSSPSSTSSYFLPHTLPMSTNVRESFQSTTPPLSAICNHLPATTPLPEAAVEFPSEHNSDNDIAEAIRLLRIGDATTESPRESPFRNIEIAVPNRLIRDADGPSMASGTTAAGPVRTGSAQPGATEAGYDSDHPLYQPNMRPCPCAATDIPPALRRHHPYLSDPAMQGGSTWPTFASTVQKPSRWSLTCPLLSGRLTKIPERFRRPTLPRGWMYTEDNGEVVKEDSSQLTYKEVLQRTRLQTAQRRLRGRVEKTQRRSDLSATVGRPTSLSPSPIASGDQPRPSLSRST